MGLAAVVGIIMSITVTQVGVSADTGNVNTSSFGDNITADANAGLGSIFEQYSLIGLMIGLGVVLVVLVGVFGFLRFRNAGV